MFYDTNLPSRLMLGTAGYPSPAILAEAITASDAGVITVSLRTMEIVRGLPKLDVMA